MASGNAGVIALQLGLQRERENCPLASSLENFMNIDCSGLITYQTGRLDKSLFPGGCSPAISSAWLIGLPFRGVMGRKDTVISSSTKSTWRFH